MPVRITKPLLVIAFSVLFLLAGYQYRRQQRPGEAHGMKRPNVVLIVADTLRADRLAMYGHARDNAPFLEELAKESVLFENAYSTCGWTTPATASIFTSLYPHQHRVELGWKIVDTIRENRTDQRINEIPDGILTLPEAFKRAGFTTFGISDNYRIGEQQISFRRGFDYFESFRYGSAEKVNEQLVRWGEHLEQAAPYFIYLHYMDVHPPYHLRTRHGTRVVTRRSPRNAIEAAPDSELRYLDRQIADLYHQFDWGRNTIFVFTSDHGQEFWDRGEFGHGHSLYQELIRVPLFVRASSLGLAPRTIVENASLVDLFPTLLELAGLPPVNNVAGTSLAAAMGGDEAEIEGRALFARDRNSTPRGAWSGRCSASYEAGISSSSTMRCRRPCCST